MPEQDKALPVSSSRPPQFTAEQERLFREVLEIFNASAIPYVVSGAFALHEHTGIWRDTKDLDLFLPDKEVPATLDLLMRHGFRTEICDPVWLCKVHRGDYFVDLISGMSNATIRVDRSWVERAGFSQVLGVPVRILAAEELVASKIFVTRRERFDGADIAHIIYRAGRQMNWKRVLDLVGEHWEMLLWSLMLFHYVYPESQSVPKWLWSELLGKFISSLDNPPDSEHFRGSLIDDKMFAIDVREWNLPDLLEELRNRVEASAERAEKPAA